MKPFTCKSCFLDFTSSKNPNQNTCDECFKLLFKLPSEIRNDILRQKYVHFEGSKVQHIAANTIYSYTRCGRAFGSKNETKNNGIPFFVQEGKKRIARKLCMRCYWGSIDQALEKLR